MSKLERKIKTGIYFKLLNPIQQQTVLSKTNQNHLKRGISIARKKGFERLKKEHNFSEYNTNIIQEITTKKQTYAN